MALHPLQLEIIVGYHVGAVNRTWVLYKDQWCLQRVLKLDIHVFRCYCFVLLIKAICDNIDILILLMPIKIFPSEIRTHFSRIRGRDSWE